MEAVSTIRELVNLWPTRASLHEDLRRHFPSLPVSVHRIHKWAETGSIPPRYHHPVFVAAQDRKFPVTAELIARLHCPEASAA